MYEPVYKIFILIVYKKRNLLFLRWCMHVRVYVCVYELEVCMGRFFRPGPSPLKKSPFICWPVRKITCHLPPWPLGKVISHLPGTGLGPGPSPGRPLMQHENSSISMLFLHLIIIFSQMVITRNYFEPKACVKGGG